MKINKFIVFIVVIVGIIFSLFLSIFIVRHNTEIEYKRATSKTVLKTKQNGKLYFDYPMLYIKVLDNGILSSKIYGSGNKKYYMVLSSGVTYLTIRNPYSNVFKKIEVDALQNN